MTDSADDTLLRVDPRSVDVERVGWWISTGCVSGGLCLIAILALLMASSSLAAAVFSTWLVVSLCHVWLTLRWPELAYSHTWYRADERGIEIRRGVIWRHRIAVPRSRVQHIDVTQGPLQRSYGIGTLVLFTAGTSHSRVTLTGLAYPAALSLRDSLLPKDDDDAV